MSPTDRDCQILREDMRLWALGEIAAKPTNHWQSTRVQSDQRLQTVYSYGRHFPLATVYNRGRRNGLILLNGDTAGAQGWRRTRTNDHQTAIRRIAEEICNERAGWSVIILPLSALDGAGIDGGSIRPLEIRADTTDHFSHTAILPRDTFGSAPARGMMRNPRAYDWRKQRVESEPLEIPADTAVERRRVTLAIESSDGRAGAGIERAGIPANATREATVTRKTVWQSGHYGRNGWESIEHNPPRFEYAVSGAVGASSNPAYPTTASADLPSGETTGAGAAVRLGWSSWRHWLGDALFVADRIAESSRACHTADTNAPDGASCEQCGGSLRRDGFERQTIRRRYRFLSSFDYNERAPLYFLAALPTKSRAQSVAMALDDLAPAAVHAALARGLAVERQGDIFFIPTALDDAAIEARGARRARLTMFTREARPRVGEIGYAPKLNAAQRRAMAQWRREEWRRLVALDMGASLISNRLPRTDAGARKRFATMRADHAKRVAALDAKLRAAILGNAPRERYHYGYDYGACSIARNRAVILQTVTRARQSLDYCERCDGRDSNGARTVAESRDRYRALGKRRAIDLWAQAGHNARLRFDPMSVIGSDQWRQAQTDTREALAIYGTAHTATDVAVTSSGTFARGTVRHIPAVANERRDADHAPLQLAENVWYLAVRNAVPRMVGTVAPRRRGW
jgi:hypothetical protein